ncbi:molybdopterin molybdenumtransferase [Hapalosiphon sp. MRB220]|nr:molybdopterin molybdenumtransferase [Hapalosiphon sp. MRB220]
MLSVSEAEEIIFNLIQPLNNQYDTEIVDLFAADSRILASVVTSQLDFPYWDNSAMDGYAVRYADVQQATPQQPAILEVIEEIPAGYQPKSIIQQGQAVRIFTGAVMPKGADTVIMQEHTQREENRVFILTAPTKPQEFVRQRAAYYQSEKQLLPPGIMLHGSEIAVLATAQCTQVSVYRRPRVAIFSTGNELVAPNQPLQLGQIVDSNQYALAALVRQSGGEPLILGIVPDEPAALEKAIAYAVSNADIVISSGGVSVGDYDYVEEIIKSLEGKIHIQAVAMKPGKPLTVATFRNQVIYFGLPGNPASALVTFWRFVQPTIKKLSGLVEGWQPKFVKAFTDQELRSNSKWETYIWGKLDLQNGIYKFQPAGGNQSSGNLINLAQTNGLAVLSVGQTLVSPGEEVQVLFY